MKIIPRHTQILVKPDEPLSGKTESGLVRPENEEKEKQAKGTVVAVGPEVEDVKPGNRVIYGAYAGEELIYETVDEDDHILLFDEDVLAFIED